MGEDWYDLDLGHDIRDYDGEDMSLADMSAHGRLMDALNKPVPVVTTPVLSDIVSKRETEIIALRELRATLTIEVYEGSISGQAPFLVTGYRRDGGTPQVYPKESDKAVVDWLKGQLKRLNMERTI